MMERARVFLETPVPIAQDPSAQRAAEGGKRVQAAGLPIGQRTAMSKEASERTGSSAEHEERVSSRPVRPCCWTAEEGLKRERRKNEKRRLELGEEEEEEWTSEGGKEQTEVERQKKERVGRERRR